MWLVGYGLSIAVNAANLGIFLHTYGFQFWNFNFALL